MNTKNSKTRVESNSLITQGEIMSKATYRIMSFITAFILALGSFTSTKASSASVPTMAAVSYYVSANGSDSNPGTSSSAPFKTIQKAATKAAAGDTINLLAGTYTKIETVTLKGTSTAPIYITGNNAVFDGGSLILKNSQWLVLQGLTFKNAEDEISVLSSHFIVLKNNVFDFTHAGILIKEYSSHLVVENNEFYQTCAAGKTWSQLKYSACEGGAVYGSSFGGGTYHIRNNYVHDVFNGFLFTDDSTGKWMNSNVFIYSNRFERVVDDPAEPEGDSFNFHVYGNTMIDTHRVASLTTSGLGPVFIYNNVQITTGNPTNEADRLNSAFKIDLSRGYTNGLWIFNNTIIGTAADNFSAFDILSRTVTSPWTVRNNIYVTANKAFNAAPTSGSFDYDISKAPFGVTEPNGKVADALLTSEGKLSSASPAIGKAAEISISTWFTSSTIISRGANLGAFQAIPAPAWVSPPGYPSQIPANVVGWPDAAISLPETTIFADVYTDYWASQSIIKLYQNSITGGCGTSPLIYCPENAVTRAEMVVFLERGMKGSGYNVPDTTTQFGDTANHWAQDWIDVAASDGITSGCGNGNFCPDGVVTRAQMAIFLLRTMHGASYVPPVASGTMFTDVPDSYWAAAWIEQLAVEGITSGCGNGSYCPDDSVTRAQLAVFLVRTFNLQ